MERSAGVASVSTTDTAAKIDVRLDRVTKRFGEVTAVDDLVLGIDRGEFFSLLGPSGCGKTTSLRMIGGFEEPTAGTIYLGGNDVTGGIADDAGDLSTVGRDSDQQRVSLGVGRNSGGCQCRLRRQRFLEFENASANPDRILPLLSHLAIVGKGIGFEFVFLED